MHEIIDRTGETNIANNGMKMTIIAYRKNNDIDIQFEDGTIVYNKQYGKFKTGNIRYPAITNRIGETRIMKCGLKATIIKYNDSNNIDIKFEDNVIVYNKTYGSFKKGMIKHPSINTQTNNAAKNRIGETRMMSCGLKATLTQYNNADNINIQFEDGITVYNKRYSNFKTGKIGHPNIDTNAIKSTINRTGETRMMNCGLKATIIKYNNVNNIDIQFEDNTIVYNKYYTTFKIGQIKHPNINVKTLKYATKYTGETRTMYCGQKATIIKYNNANNIDVKFENGIVAHNKLYKNFKIGYIKYPNVINTIKLKEFAYKFNDNWYYICSHPTWTEDKILSVKEIYAYQSN